MVEVTVVVFMVLLVAVQGWRCCGDALVLAWCDGWCDGVVMLRRCGGAVMFVGLVRWECDCVALWEWDGAAMSGRCCGVVFGVVEV